MKEEAFGEKMNNFNQLNSRLDTYSGFTTHQSKKLTCGMEG